MEKVKTWQKVTIAILVAALLVVVTVIVMNERYGAAKTAQGGNQAGYSVEAETQTRDYSDEIENYTTAPATTKKQSVPSAKEIANELYKQFEKNYGKAYKTSTKNEFYNPYYHVEGRGVQIMPFHIWYQDGKMYVDSYVVNMQPNSVKNITVDDYTIDNGEQIIGEDAFGTLNGNIELAPGEHTTHCFVFPKGSFEYANLRNEINADASVRWIDF